MPSIKVAHLHEQGVDMIIAPLDDSFEYKPEADKRRAIAELQLRSQAAGLRGRVVPVWPKNGGMAYIAPDNWRPFFNGLSLQAVWASINREIRW
jgi:hypothetical protein